MSIERCAIVWIDTDGKFHIQGFEFQHQAIEYEQGLNESGLPTRFVSRNNIIALNS